MSQKNESRQRSNCPKTVETTVVLADGSINVPAQKRKEDAKQTLYLNRI